MGLWKAIRRRGHFISGKLSFVLEIGQRVKFWKEKCCGYAPLNLSFPSLFAITLSKEAWVWEVWKEDGE